MSSIEPQPLPPPVWLTSMPCFSPLLPVLSFLLDDKSLRRAGPGALLVSVWSGSLAYSLCERSLVLGHGGGVETHVVMVAPLH